MLPVQLVEEVRALCEEGRTASLIEADGVANVIFENYEVKSGHYSKNRVELLVRAPLSYPNGKPDMFWVDDDLVLKDGRQPMKGDVFETLLGKRRRRFSWHLTQWNPGCDNLVTYLEFIDARFAKAE